MAVKNILTDLKNIRDNEVSVTSAINYLKEFVKRKFNEVISIHDHKLRADELVRTRDFTPRMLDEDTKTLQYSIKDALITANVGGDQNTLTIGAGKFYNHSFYASDRKTIKAIKALSEPYDPSRTWNIALTNITIANNNGHWLYLKVSTATGVTTSELFVSEAHIDPLRDEGFVIYKLGWVSPVLDGKREVTMIFGNVVGGNDGKSAYEIAVLNGFPGTEIQWLASLKGNDGKQIEVSASGGYFVYRYVGDENWINISPLPDNGNDGRSPEFSFIENYLCYRLIGDSNWISLVSIEDLKGDEGDPGPGVAGGGTTGQKLVKHSDTNFDTEWIDDEPGFPDTITSETENAVFEEDGVIKHTHMMGKVDVHNVEQKLKRGTGLLYPSFITQFSGDKSISSSTDWIVPPKEIFENLLNSIDVPNEDGNIWPLAGGKLKEAELTLWDIPNEGATNDYGFNGTPTATRFPWGQFANYRSMGRLWTSSVYVEGVASYFLEYDKDNSAVTLSYAQCNNGCGIRLCNPSTLLAEGQVGSYTQNNGKVVPTKVINGVEWTTRNIDETMYFDGTYIKGFDNNVYTHISNSEWSANAGEGMLCSFNDDTEIAFGLDQKTLLQLFAEKQDSLTADSDYLTPATAAQTYAPITVLNDIETILASI